ncbi:unnamed protein product, partial [Laminaria digitata]
AFSSPICQLRYNNGSPPSSETMIAAPRFEEAPIGYSSSPGSGGRDGAGWAMNNSGGGGGGRGSPRSGDRGLGATAGSGSGNSNGIVSPLERRYIIDREQKSNSTNNFS